MSLARITVLVSGRGSNLASLIDAAAMPGFPGVVTHVVCNRPLVPALSIARSHGIATTVVDHKAFAGREAFDVALAQAVDASEPDLVVLAGFMRVLGRAFVGRYEGRLLNIHPSLLPLYPGLDTHRRAIEDGVRMHGCTVHFVTPDVDVGPIVAQGAVPVAPDDDERALAARVLAVEHRLLPIAVRWFCEGRLSIEGKRVRVHGAAAPDGALIAPAVATAAGREHPGEPTGDSSVQKR